MIGMGSKLAYSASSPVDWTAVSGIRSLDIPTFVAETIDNTTLDTANLQRTTEPGLSSVAPLSITVKTDWDDTSFLYLLSLQESRTEVWWRAEAVANDEQTEFMGFEFKGRIGDYKPTLPAGGLQETTFTLHISTAVYRDAAKGATQIT